MISAGGTGGGVYPALAVAGALRRLYPDARLLFVGARGDMARDLVERASDEVQFDHYYEVLSGPVHGVPRLRQLISGLKIIIGIVQSLILAVRQRPHGGPEAQRPDEVRVLDERAVRRPLRPDGVRERREQVGLADPEASVEVDPGARSPTSAPPTARAA